MASVIIGIFLVIVSVVTWLGHVTPAHAIAILLGAIGVLLIIGGVVPVRYFRRELLLPRDERVASQPSMVWW